MKTSKYCLIPKNIDIDSLVGSISGNKTKILYLKDGMVYFLSLLVFHNHSVDDREDGYKRINEKILSTVIGQKRPAQIIKILEQCGVIEIKPYSKGHFSRGFRLSEQYNTGVFQKVELSKRIQDKLNLRHINNSDEIIEKRYEYIPKQFKKNKLSFDSESIENYIRNLGIELFHKSILLPERWRGLTLKSLFNFLGRLMSLREDIEKGHFHLNFSPSNHRFHSNLTSLPRELRCFLLINGEKITEVDISSSQPYILSTILSEQFVTSESNGYNLFSIYSELYDEMNSVRKIIPTNKKGNDYYRLGVHINRDDLEGLQRFSEIDFSKDFYNTILNEGQRISPKHFSSKKSPEINRDYIKNHIMNFLFERNEFYREENSVIKILRSLYPELCDLIERFNHFYGNRKFALLLQRTESYLMLGNVCRRIYLEYPDTPFLTIHDSIITTQSNSLTVYQIIKDSIKSITGKDLTVKVKDLMQEDFSKSVEESWVKVKVSDLEKYDRIKYSLLQSNIKKGMKILTEQDQKYWIRMEEEIRRYH